MAQWKDHEEGTQMVQKLIRPRRDDRIARAIADPKAYFDQARERALREVAAEMDQERNTPAPRRRLAR